MESRLSQLPQMTSTPRHYRNTVSLEVAFREVSPIFPVKKAKSLSMSMSIKKAQPVIPALKLTKENTQVQLDVLSNRQITVENPPQALPQPNAPNQSTSKKSVSFTEAPVVMEYQAPPQMSQDEQQTAAENMSRPRPRSITTRRTTSVLPSVPETCEEGDEIKTDVIHSGIMILKSPENSVGTLAWKIPPKSRKTYSLKRKSNTITSERKTVLLSNTQEAQVGNLFEDTQDLSPLEPSYSAKKRKTYVFKGKNQKGTDNDNNNGYSEKLNILGNSNDKNMVCKDNKPSSSADYKTSIANEETKVIEEMKENLNIDGKDAKQKHVSDIKKRVLRKKTEIAPNDVAGSSPVILKSRKRKNNENIDSKVMDQKNDAATSSSKRKVKRKSSISLKDINQWDVVENQPLDVDTKKSTQSEKLPNIKSSNTCDEEEVKLTNTLINSPESLKRNLKTSKAKPERKTIKRSSSVVDTGFETQIKAARQSIKSVGRTKKSSGKKTNIPTESVIQIKDSAEGPTTPLSSSQIAKLQSPAKTSEKLDLVRKSRRILRSGRNVKPEKTTSKDDCEEEPDSSNTCTGHKKKKDPTNTETDYVAIAAESEVNERTNGECLQQEDQNLMKASVKKRAINISPEKTHTLKKQPLRKINQNVRGRSAQISTKDEDNIVNDREIGKLSTRKSRAKKMIVSDDTNLIFSSQNKKCESTSKHSDSAGANQHNEKEEGIPESKGETLPESQIPTIATRTRTAKKSRKRISTKSGGDKNEDKKEVRPKSPIPEKTAHIGTAATQSRSKEGDKNGADHHEDKEERNPVLSAPEKCCQCAHVKGCHSISSQETIIRVFYAQQCFRLKEVKVTEPSPGVTLRTQLHIDSYVMTGTMTLRPGASVTKSSTNTAYFVLEGAALVTIGSLTKTLRPEEGKNAFFIPKRSEFSIVNEESTPLIMVFTKFKG